MKCPNCGSDAHLYANLDTKWNPFKQCWIIVPESIIYSPVECTNCDELFKSVNELTVEVKSSN